MDFVPCLRFFPVTSPPRVWKPEVPGGSLNNLKLVEATTHFAEVGVVHPLEDVFWKLWQCLVWNGEDLGLCFSAPEIIRDDVSYLWVFWKPLIFSLDYHKPEGITIMILNSGESSVFNSWQKYKKDWNFTNKCLLDSNFFWQIKALTPTRGC